MARIFITCIDSFLYFCSLKTCGFLASLTQLLKLFSQATQKSLHVKPEKIRGKVGRAVQPNISTHVARAGGQSLVCDEGIDIRRLCCMCSLFSAGEKMDSSYSQQGT
jgi:hypothetical protein